MQKVVLYSKEQDEAIGYLTFQFDNKFTFNAYTVTAWGGVTEIIESNFFVEGYIKWDGCSHINFHG